ncbi:hypothetical protein ENUP19_0066G0004 [Entamoeba nuttalli]|uniref:Uncharacterized protein n=1 Tax=Entamoeba nuttalli TaxID=412467 RepID=A0ABQ0DE57_9EUKA
MLQMMMVYIVLLQVVLSTNEEENIIYSQWIEKILSPYDDVDMIVSGGISNFTESVMKREYGNILDDPHICKVRESYVSPEVLGEWYTNPNIIRSSLLFWLFDNNKKLKEWGSAIIVGYGGDLYGEDEEFEVGLTSSNAINRKIPSEFLKDIVDERIHVSSSTYYKERITEETKKIVEKYKTKCNPKNKRLVKRDSRCDKEINIQHGHGGYECGYNGEWSTKCVLSYCDSGYKFDYINNKSIEDGCVYQQNQSNGTPRMKINMFLIIIGIITLIL